MDFTETIRDGQTILNDKGDPRRPQQLNLKSDLMNDEMTKIAQKKIGFLGSVKSNHLDQKKMD